MEMRLSFILLFSLIFSCALCYTQLSLQFQGFSSARDPSLVLTSDGGFFVVWNYNTALGSTGYTIKKLSAEGRTQNEINVQCETAVGMKKAYNMVRTSDGGLLIIGIRSIDCFPNTDLRTFVAKYTFNGGFVNAYDLTIWPIFTSTSILMINNEVFVCGFEKQPTELLAGKIQKLSNDGYPALSAIANEEPSKYYSMAWSSTNLIYTVGVKGSPETCFITKYSLSLDWIINLEINVPQGITCNRIVVTMENDILVSGYSATNGDAYLGKFTQDLAFIMTFARYTAAPYSITNIYITQDSPNFLLGGHYINNLNKRAFFVDSVSIYSDSIDFQIIDQAYSEYDNLVTMFVPIGNSYYASIGLMNQQPFLRVFSRNCLIGQYFDLLENQCKMCPPGSYSRDGQVTECIRCSAGFYQDQGGKESCISCPVGKFSDTEGSIICTDCPFLTYANKIGSNKCDPCSTAYGTGSTSCEDCPAGTYKSATGPISCQAGKYNPYSTCVSQCLDCPAGTYSDVGQAFCKSCSEGKYQAYSGKPSCDDCPAGTYCPNQGMISPIDCSPGYYQDLNGQTACKPCSAGTENPEAGKSGCTDCTLGKFSATNGASLCIDCPANQKATSTSSCSPCVNQVAAAGSTTCSNPTTGCLPGTYPNAGSCTLCPPGTSGSGTGPCVPCPAGSYGPIAGLKTCYTCRPGTYQASAGKISCDPCPANNECKTEGLTAAVKCKPGYYEDQQGSTACKKCSPGTFTLREGTYKCFSCPKGYYSFSPGSTSCMPCGENTFSDDYGSVICKTCPFDSIAEPVNATYCTQRIATCPAGNFMNAYTNLCTPCPSGKNQSVAGKTYCEDCPMGTYSDNIGQSECTPCPLGQYQSSTGQQTCSPCSAGNKCSILGLNAPQPCEPGTYQASTGQSSCILCDLGQFQGYSGSTSCSDCTAGTYSDKTGAARCTNCPAGTYQDESRKTSCKICSPGSYSNERASSCSPCSIGLYQDLPNSASCKQCPAGKSSNMGAITCFDCDAGYYSIIGSSCMQCSPGHYNGNVGSPSCNPCQDGYYSDSYGSTKCTPCPEGTKPSYDKRTCEDCPAGTYNPTMGLGICSVCSLGYYSLPRSTKCDPCPPGTKIPIDHPGFCDDCPAGTYQPAELSEVCIKCEPGTYAAGTKQTTCSPCTAGHYQPDAGQISCLECTSGSFQDMVGKTYCDKCPAGKFQSMSGQTSCLTCPAGEYQDQPGSSSCNKCPVGKYQSASGMTSCIDCQGETYSNVLGATSCTRCIYGYYALEDHTNCFKPGETADFNRQAIINACSDPLTQAIIKPFTNECTTMYRPMCCTGSSKIPNRDCNEILDIKSPTDSMYDKYCSACKFMNKTACPADGLCWSDAAWLVEARSPYSGTYSPECLNAISEYCGPRLIANFENDLECSLFKSSCKPIINNAEYFNDFKSFKITFDKSIHLPIPYDCDSLFDPVISPEINKGALRCRALSSFEIEVDMSGLEYPITKFLLKPNALKDACGIPINTETIRFVRFSSSVFTPLETLYAKSLLPDNILINKCLGLPLISSIQKPYHWPIFQQFWNITYEIPDPLPTAKQIDDPRFANIGYNKSFVNITESDLIPTKTLYVRTVVVTAFKNVIRSEWLQFTIPNILGEKKYCGPCQLTDRSLCIQLNNICWDDYLNYSNPDPLNYTSCLKEIAPICYSKWTLTNTTTDAQCLDFAKYFNLSLMQIKPTIVDAYFINTGKAFRIEFDHPILQEKLIDCSRAFDFTTLNWLPTAKSCRWISPKIIEVDYDPQKGIMPSATIAPKAFYYDYQFAQEAVDQITIKIKQPPLDASLQIQSLPAVSECDEIDLTGTTVQTTLYPLNFKWNVTFNPSLDTAMQKEADEYFAQFKESYTSIRNIKIPNKFIKKNSEISILLSGKASTFESSEITKTTTVKVFEDVPKIRFSSKSAFVLELDGSKSNSIPLQIDNKKCKSETDNIVVEAMLSLKSGDTVDKINVYGDDEKTLETALNKDYAELKEIFVSAKQGFKYMKYYNLTATIKSADTGIINTDSLILLIVKPEIKSMIESPGSLVSIISQTVNLDGSNSIFPASEGDTLGYSWRCVNADSLQSGTSCLCPILPDSLTTVGMLKIPSNKLAAPCKYKYSLTVSATSGTFKRVATNTTEFMTISTAAISLKGRVVKGNDPDATEIYFTFGASSGISNSNFEWTLVEAESLDPLRVEKFTLKNTFIYNFFKEKLKIIIDPSIKDNDNGLPESNMTLDYMTSKTTRVLGIAKNSLLPNYKYTFAVTALSETAPTFLLIDFNTPPHARPRNFTVSPASGTAFSTQFQFTFTLPSSTDVDEGEYMIFRRNCPDENNDTTPITMKFGQANSFSTILGPSLKSCKGKVQLILRVFEYDETLDTTFDITIEDPKEPLEQILAAHVAKLSEDTSISIKNKLAILAEISNVQSTEQTESGKALSHAMYNILAKINQPGGVFERMENSSKVELLSAVIGVMSRLVENQEHNINLTLASTVSEKLHEYLKTVKPMASGSLIIPNTVDALSAVSKIGTGNKQNATFFAPIKQTLGNMTEMKLNELLPGAKPYKINTPSIDVIVEKDYADTYFKENKTFKTEKGLTMNLPPLSKKSNKARRILEDSNSTYTLGASVTTTAYNPYSNVKSNTNISISSLTNGTTQGFKPETIKKIYDDIPTGKLNDIVDQDKVPTDIVETQFTQYDMKDDSTEIPVNTTIDMGNFADGKSMIIQEPVSDTTTKVINTAISVPLYFVMENDAWTNDNCGLELPSASNPFMTVKCDSLGPISLGNPQEMFVFTIDVVTDVFGVIKAGNYEQLGDLGVFVKMEARTAIAAAVIVSIITVVIIIFILLIHFDKSELYKARLDCLLTRFKNNPIAIQVGLLHNVMAFYRNLKKKGLQRLAKKARKTVIPKQAVSSPTESEVDLKRTNSNEKSKKEEDKPIMGKVTKVEQSELLDLFWMHKQCNACYDNEEFADVMTHEFESCVVLNRLTRSYIEDKVVNEPATMFLMLITDNPMINAFMKPEMQTPRPIKFLILACAIIGELFFTGYFNTTATTRDSHESQVSDVLIYTLATVALMIPLKLIICFFLVGNEFKEDMTRTEIENCEKCEASMQRMGVALGWAWLIGCLYGILMYISSFSEDEIYAWISTFAISVLLETIFVPLLKSVLKITLALILMKCSSSQFMYSTAGLVASKLVDFLVMFI